MNVLLYQQGGTLELDELLQAQPSAATISVKTEANDDLTSIDSTFTDIDAAAATVETLVLTLGAATAGAKQVTVSSAAGTPNPDPSNPAYRILIETATGRKAWMRVSARTVVASDVTVLEFDTGIPFDVAAGDTASSVRVTHAVDWSAVTSTFTGRVVVRWKPTVDGVVEHFVKLVDVVKQLLPQPASWTDVVAEQGDIATQLRNRVPDPELLVRVAWDKVQRKLSNMGLRTNLLVPDAASFVLRDAVVFETLMELTKMNVAPSAWRGSIMEYKEYLENERDRALGQLQEFWVDEDEDEVVGADEFKTRLNAWASH